MKDLVPTLSLGHLGVPYDEWVSPFAAQTRRRLRAFAASYGL